MRDDHPEVAVVTARRTREENEADAPRSTSRSGSGASCRRRRRRKLNACRARSAASAAALVPRNRTARLAVLGSSVQRAAALRLPLDPLQRPQAPDRRGVPRAALARPDHGVVPLERARPRAERRARRCCGRSRSRRTASRGRSATPRLDARPVPREAREREAERAERGAAARSCLDEAALARERRSSRSALHYQDPPRFPKDFDRVRRGRAHEPDARSTRASTISAGSDHGVAVEDVVVTARRASSARSSTGLSRDAHVARDADHRRASAVRAADVTNPSRVGIVAAAAARATRSSSTASEGQARRDRRHDHHGRLAGAGRAAVALPAQHPDRHGHERRPDRHRHLQAHPGAAVRRLLVAPVGARARPEAAGRDGRRLAQGRARPLRRGARAGRRCSRRTRRSATATSCSSRSSRSRSCAARSSARSPASAPGSCSTPRTSARSASPRCC